MNLKVTVALLANVARNYFGVRQAPDHLFSSYYRPLHNFHANIARITL